MAVSFQRHPLSPDQEERPFERQQCRDRGLECAGMDRKTAHRWMVFNDNNLQIFTIITVVRLQFIQSVWPDCRKSGMEAIV